MDWQSLLFQMGLGSEPPITESRIQDRLRGAYGASGPLWDAPHVRGLPMSMMPRHLDFARYAQEMAPLWQYLSAFEQAAPPPMFGRR